MIQGPRRVVSVLLSFIVLSAGFLSYWNYSQTFYKLPGMWIDVVAGTANAPNQYRIGVVDTAYLLSRHMHLGMRHTLAILDLIAGFIAVFTLFFILRRSAVYRNASREGQWFGAAGFAILVQYYLAWLLWYQRPETLSTAAVLSLSLLLLTLRLPLPSGFGRFAAVIGFLLLAVAQGFVRADVAFALHLGILLVCLTPAGKGFALPRVLQAATSVVAVLLAVGIQYFLMKRMFPQASYGDTPVFQLFLNLKSPQNYISFLLFMLPFGWTAAMLIRRHYQVNSAAIATFTGALIFIAMWFTVGRIEEVRIFLPFALALAPLTVELAMRGFLGQVQES